MRTKASGSPMATAAGNVSRGKGVMVVSVNSELSSDGATFKDAVFLNHVVPQFPQMQGEDNYSIYGIGLL